jgi:hypothetical protein
VLVGAGLVRVVLCHHQEIRCHQGSCRPQGILLVALPLEVLPIQMEFWEGRFFFPLCLEGLLDPVLSPGIGLRRLR